jgi:large subunit ribosomal protein L29
MVNLKAEALRECDDDELEQRLVNARKELFNLRFQVATGRLDNVARIGLVRREVARVLTVQRDREIAAAEAVAAGEAPAVFAPRRAPAVSAPAPAEKRRVRGDELQASGEDLPEDEFSEDELEDDLPEDEPEDELADDELPDDELEDELPEDEEDDDEGEGPGDEADDDEELEDELPEDEMLEDEATEEQ